MTKILYSEDIEFLRQGISADLGQEIGFQVIPCELSREETLRKVEQETPQVLLLDVMSKTDINAGIRIAEELKHNLLRKNGKLKILLLTIFRNDDEAIKRALDQRLADGIVTKPTTTDRIVKEINRVINS